MSGGGSSGRSWMSSKSRADTSATGVLAGDDGLTVAGKHLDELTTFADDVTAAVVLPTDWLTAAANRCCIMTLALVLLRCNVVLLTADAVVAGSTSACWINRDKWDAFLSASLPAAVTMPTTSIRTFQHRCSCYHHLRVSNCLSMTTESERGEKFLNIYFNLLLMLNFRSTAIENLRTLQIVHWWKTVTMNKLKICSSVYLLSQ